MFHVSAHREERGGHTASLFPKKQHAFSPATQACGRDTSKRGRRPPHEASPLVHVPNGFEIVIRQVGLWQATEIKKRWPWHERRRQKAASWTVNNYLFLDVFIVLDSNTGETKISYIYILFVLSFFGRGRKEGRPYSYYINSAGARQDASNESQRASEVQNTMRAKNSRKALTVVDERDKLYWDHGSSR